jgi:hypothetical protein
MVLVGLRERSHMNHDESEADLFFDEATSF